MTTRLDPKAAADRIRGAFHERPALHPDARHAHAFAKEVCGHLDVEPTADNIAQVNRLLHETNIAPHVVEGYPKMATRAATQSDVDGKRVRFVGELIPVLDEAGNPVVHESAESEKDASKPADDGKGKVSRARK
jgi:hypothetical protein